MNRLKHIAWMILLLASCGEAEEVMPPEGISVEVTRKVHISLQPMQVVGTPATRTGEQPEWGEAIHATYQSEDVKTRATDMTAAEQAINNAYILQFSGTAATSILKKKQAITATQLKSGAPLTCAFVMTSGVKNRVYVVANCTKTLTEGTTTLGDFEAPVTMSPATAVPAGGLPFSACQDVGVGDEFEPFLVKGVLAKLTFTCKTAGATLKLKGLPVGYSFYTQAEPTDGKLRPVGMTYNASGFAMTSGTTYYVPENLSGRNELLIHPVTRALGMAPDNAMYVEVTNASTVYNLLLGDGTPSDFNVAGSYAYTLSATVYGTDPYDLRIGNPVVAAPQDLNAEGATANCYIATSADTWYMFRSDVMGNGAMTPSITPEPLDTRSADVLWETQNTTTAPAKGAIVAGNVYLLKDRILFKTGNTEGNAVIAARDASNTIIWSWHIWRLSDRIGVLPLAAIGDLTPDGGLVMMDRNLGALSATANDNLSTGFHYQWGRKDPFPAFAGFTSPNNGAIATTPSSMPIVPGSVAQYSIAQSIQQPTTFFKASGDWCVSRNDNLWGTPLTISVSVNGNDYNVNKGRKSIYDPCPPGWRVPPAYAFVDVITSKFLSISGNRVNNTGVMLGIGSGGHYWTSTPNVNTPSNGNKLYFNTGGTCPACNSDRSFGNSVRCVKETVVTNEVPPVDLSAAGTANCYIVSKAGRYSFATTVMGNGKIVPAHTKGSISGDADFPAITPTILSPASVEVLWETLNTTTAPAKGDLVSDVKLEGGKVIFNAGSKEGNAVIAVKNAGGIIIWSWHIWRTNEIKEFPLAAIGSLTTDGELVLMDRNLGALSATANDNLSTGLHYQWGRKDPFPAYAGLTSPNNVVMATTPNGMPILPGSTGQYSIAQSIQQPTTFFTYGDDWCSTRNDNLWGTPFTTKISINGNNFNSNSGMKSIYDPCPPGWRTPPGYAFANAAKSSMTLNNGYSFPIGQGDASCWFPASGNRNGYYGALGVVGSGGYYWTSTPLVSYPTYGSTLYFGSSLVDPAGYVNRADGSTCRCCKE